MSCVDSIDAQLCDLLEANGRAPLTRLAQAVRLSVPATKRRVDKLESQGVIQGYHAAINRGVREPTIDALVELFCAEHAEPAQLLELVDLIPEVRIAFTVAGDSDAILFVRARSAEHLEQVLVLMRRSPAVVRTRSQVLLGRPIIRGHL